MRTMPYNRAAAIAYAERWALSRNPAYYDFDGLGGDCTNFISQCVFAGSGVMNYTPDTGWFYVSPNRRAAAWTGVQQFYRFLTTNQGAGPHGRTVTRGQIQPGDIIQLGDAGGSFYHSLFVLDSSPAGIYIAAHTFDALWRPLDSYSYAAIRYLHVTEIRNR